MGCRAQSLDMLLRMRSKSSSQANKISLHDSDSFKVFLVPFVLAALRIGHVLVCKYDC